MQRKSPSTHALDLRDYLHLLSLRWSGVEAMVCQARNPKFSCEKSAVVIGLVKGNYWVAMPGLGVKASPEKLRRERRANRLVELQLLAAKADLETRSQQKNSIDVAGRCIHHNKEVCENHIRIQKTQHPPIHRMGGAQEAARQATILPQHPLPRMRLRRK